MQDGNLVLYDSTNLVLWHSDTSDGTDQGDINAQICPVKPSTLHLQPSTLNPKPQT